MKTLLLISLLLSSMAVSSSKYEETMQNSIDKLYKLHTTAELNQMAALFSRIAEKEQDEWLPYYYAAYAHTSATFFAKDKDEIDASLDKAQAILDQVMEMEADKSEAFVLQALIYSMRIAASPLSAYKYSTKSEEALCAAEKINANNPRIHYCRGNNVYNTPKMFGGGSSKARPHFEKAQELFKTITITDPLMPAWGQMHNQQMLEQCQADQ